MVELEADDYMNILRWFEYRFAHHKAINVPLESRRTFWKLTFLAEDKNKSDKIELNDRE